jgi:hypothetical protein
MKDTAAIQDKLNLLYDLQKEQEFQLSEGISKLSNIFTPVKLISELFGNVVQTIPQVSQVVNKSYSPLWDKLTDQMGITSPIAKSAIHMVLDQMMTKWLETNEMSAQNKVQTERKSELMDHSLNHF